MSHSAKAVLPVDDPNADVVKVLTWNIHANCGAGNDRLRRIADAIAGTGADLLLLQEVGLDRNCSDRLETLLARHGFGAWWCSAASDRSTKRYGSAIVARRTGSITACAGPATAPWPQLIARATVSLDGRDVHVFSVHIPNGSEHGWAKVETFEALAESLDALRGQPCIVGGDFNEPRTFGPGEALVSFGASDDGRVDGDKHGSDGRRFPRRRWQAAVERVLLGPASGLRHAWRRGHPGETAATHVVRGRERFFDHLLISPHFEVVDAGFRHDWCEGDERLSDHSGVWAEVRWLG